MPNHSRLTSTLFGLAVLAISLIALFAGSVGSASAATARTVPPMPDQGIFENCPLDTNLTVCEQRLQVMHAGGLKVVVIGLRDSSSLANIQAYAQAAQSVGMSVMWEINDPIFWGGAPITASAATDFPEFSAACGCTASSDILTYMINWLAALPNTYGYYAADDQSISAGQSAGLAAYVQQIRSLDPGAMVMIGTYPSAGSQNANIGATLGDEIYPVTTDPLMPAGNALAQWDAVRWSVRSDQAIATQYGASSAFILQAFTFGDNLSDGQAIGVCTPTMSQQTCYSKLRYPSAATQLHLRNQVIRHAHPKLILWYNFDATYGQAGNDTYSIYPTGSVASARWAGLAKAIQAPSPYAVIAHAAKKKRHHHHRRCRRHRHHHHRRCSGHRHHHRGKHHRRHHHRVHNASNHRRHHRGHHATHHGRRHHAKHHGKHHRGHHHGKHHHRHHRNHHRRKYR